MVEEEEQKVEEKGRGGEEGRRRKRRTNMKKGSVGGGRRRRGSKFRSKSIPSRGGTSYDIVEVESHFHTEIHRNYKQLQERPASLNLPFNSLQINMVSKSAGEGPYAPLRLSADSPMLP